MKVLKRVIAFLCSVCMLPGMLCLSAFAAQTSGGVEVSEKPASDTTTGQPFAPDTGGSQEFRIPGIVQLDDGTLIAVADARWNIDTDGGGTDTIASVSKDRGATWQYTFANYHGDNGNEFNARSTTFIDPAIATDGKTAYMIVDFMAAGLENAGYLYRPVAGQNGLDENGNLRLRLSSEDTIPFGEEGYNTAAAAAEYPYYLDKETLQIKDYATNSVVSGYTVDGWFNIKGEDGTDTNIFYEDSPYQVYPTGYLYLTTTTDGLNWTAPNLLNLKEADEEILLIGPGNGTYDAENDRLIFCAYEYTRAYMRSCLIWMDKDGNWGRSADATVDTWSSEASCVVLADGTVRCFYRDDVTTLRYTDYTWDAVEDNYVVAAQEVMTTAGKTNNNQLSAVMYSKKIEGKDAIIVSTANSGGKTRTHGYLYVFLLNEDNSMELAYAYNINGERWFGYSCLTNLDNGNLGLLWEHGGSKITYTELKMDDILTYKNDARLEFVDVPVKVGESVTITDATGEHTPDTSMLDDNIATAQVTTGEGITNIKLSGIANGYTEVWIGNYVYCITVSEYENLDVELNVGDKHTFTDSTGDYTDVTVDASDIVDVELTYNGTSEVTGWLGSNTTYSDTQIDLSDCLYTFTKNEDGTWTISNAAGTVFLNPGNLASVGYPHSDAYKYSLNIETGYKENTFFISSNGSDNANQSVNYLYLNSASYIWDRVAAVTATSAKNGSSLCLFVASENSTGEIPGFKRMTSLDEIVSGGRYLIGAMGAALGLLAALTASAAAVLFVAVVCFLRAGGGY